MARLIDADAIKYTTLSYGGWGGPPEEIAHKYDIDKMPTVDIAEVVRCMDCTQWGGVAFGNVCRRWSAPLAGMKNCTGPNDFCSYGERRNNEAD